MKQKMYKNNKELFIYLKEGGGIVAGRTRDVQKNYRTTWCFFKLKSPPLQSLLTWDLVLRKFGGAPVKKKNHTDV